LRLEEPWVLLDVFVPPTRGALRSLVTVFFRAFPCWIELNNAFLFGSPPPALLLDGLGPLPEGAAGGGGGPGGGGGGIVQWTSPYALVEWRLVLFEDASQIFSLVWIIRVVSCILHSLKSFETKYPKCWWQLLF
jgi:hypothetical protein